ncbi:MAG: LapA family protein [Oxalobacteraceae bacterium]|nr:LapA family protein [Oxalobacteraceae bacterium]
MHLRNIVLLVVLGCVALFAAVNWSAIMAPTTLSFIFTTMQAPLGLILLAATAVLAVLFLAFIVTMQTSVIMETRRLHKEVESQRKLADQAEASRFIELRSFLEHELHQMAQLNAGTAASMEARLGRTEQDLRTTLEQTGNTLAAMIGELDDSMRRNSNVPVRSSEPGS